MDEFSCRRCGKSFPRSRLLRHLSSQMPCEPLKSHWPEDSAREVVCQRAAEDSVHDLRARLRPQQQPVSPPQDRKIASTDVLEELKRLGQKMDELTKQLATPTRASVSRPSPVSNCSGRSCRTGSHDDGGRHRRGQHDQQQQPQHRRESHLQHSAVGPQNFDFERLAEAPNDLLAQSFAARTRAKP